MEIKMRRKYLTSDEKKLVIESYNAGIPIETILKNFDIGRTTLYRILQKRFERG